MNDLTLRPFLWRSTRLFPEKRLVSRTHDGTHAYEYETFGERVRSIVAALRDLGLGPGDRVGTFGWNHHRHLETYFAAPLSGAQLHTINVQLGDDDIVYIVEDAADEILFVDPGDPLETIIRLWDDLSVDQLVVMGETVPDAASELDGGVTTLEALVAEHEPVDALPPLEGSQPAGMCYTSGTTGRPKGVEYTQAMLYAHSMMVMTPAAIGIRETDVVMPVVPMFHVNSWEFPYAATMAGATQVYPGPSPTPADLVSLIDEESVTLTAGVPTVWIDVLSHLDEADEYENPLSSLERIVVGGSAAPADMMRRYEDEYDVAVEHAWGMTETMSIGSVSRPKSWMDDWSRKDRYRKRRKQGLPSPGLEMKLVAETGETQPWDGESVGELWVRGPTVVNEYHQRPDANAEEFEDGWLKTGDVAVIDEDGYVEIVDRTKDVIKSGGEWISSIELENALMAHPDVIEAAVVAVSHERWQERPLACVVLDEGTETDREELYTFLEREGEFPEWWLPDEVRVVEAIPKTATGKFDKLSLRERFDDPRLRFAPGESDAKPE
ncbi:long-chain fatty acid--CoA ligase [Natronococcus jeotgali]|uniref:AMP-dependent synthetase and ligase n=1 Tax=Natronococcus jeotgali DSM 18795 TaxID=1227498 RepID=L9X3V9_9EURY|nr:long-chain fatty acid--CoA ligase [Natronococcus jeotgali]ELY56395.1 AMP-dependent synthetase and ligase [Natronococcus jeotgali DSM 18795]